MGDLDAQFRKFRRELSSGTVSLALLAAADETMTKLSLSTIQ